MTAYASPLGAMGNAAGATPYPVWYDVPPVERHNRATVFFRGLLVLPQAIALSVGWALAGLLTLIAWMVGIFSGRYEPSLAQIPLAILRWSVNVQTYLALLRDEYPPFGSGSYPCTFEVPLQERQGRASIFFRSLLVLPHLAVGQVLVMALAAGTILAWFALLVTARYPEGLRRLTIGLLRWQMRVAAYALLLRGDFPPFSLGFDERPPFVDVPGQRTAENRLPVSPPSGVSPAEWDVAARVSHAARPDEDECAAAGSANAVEAESAALQPTVASENEAGESDGAGGRTGYFRPRRRAASEPPGSDERMTAETIDQRTLDQIALSREEYARICELLGRQPNMLELGMFGALWSEHCGYKNSRPLLRLLPSEGVGVLTRAGEENAGAVEVGDGWLVAMKIESHNHPSAIEPFQGAATGVGGIIRDIFAMAARPIALLDSLRFGPLEPAPGVDAATVARNRRLLTGVVGGIGWYGNCIGLPTVGGEVAFAPAYSNNPLVNAMCVGLARVGTLVRARADGPGNPIILVGAETGRDGIHGATFASVELNARSEERRPAVQVGNPFMEKLLMEACLELAATGWIVGMQDLGAAGLTSSAVECAARAGTGIRIDVAKVPRRESGMTPYEVMLSESQERMLVIARKGEEQRVQELFARWELHSAVIGEVTDDGMARIYDGDEEVACVPVAALTSPPQYVREGRLPEWQTEAQNVALETLPDLLPSDAEAALLALLGRGNIASKRWVYRQYDHEVGTNTVVGPGAGDAAVLRIKGTRRGIALSTDGNGRLCWLDPRVGGAIAVAEAARNVACAGARPVALTDCLNFGNPEKAEVYYQLEQAIRGIADACRTLSVPVISGNVSLYNETEGEPVYPTPVIGMLGVIEDVSRRLTMAFQGADERVWLLGASLDGEADTLAGSEYLEMRHGLVAGRPRIDLDLERRLQALVVEAAARGLLRSAHDCAEGGLAVALAECCIAGGIGLDASAAPFAGRIDAALFGERQSRIVVSVRAEDEPGLRALAAEHGVPAVFLGVTGGETLRLGSLIAVAIAELASTYENALPLRLR